MKRIMDTSNARKIKIFCIPFLGGGGGDINFLTYNINILSENVLVDFQGIDFN